MAGEKHIVICCDGTGNSFDTLSEESNVAKLYSSLALSESQIAYYHPGVGTMGAPNASTWIGREWSRFKGLAFGSGLLENVGDAYRFLMDTFADGDQIFLFGFSRGAFTVRDTCQSYPCVWIALCGKSPTDPVHSQHVCETLERGRSQMPHIRD